MRNRQFFSQSFNPIFSSLFKTLACVVLAFSFFAAPSAMAAKTENKAAIAQVRVSINSADAEELAAQLKGIGIKKAEAIVSFRKKNGKFKSVDELAQVKGIGEATIEKNRSKLTL